MTHHHLPPILQELIDMLRTEVILGFEIDRPANPTGEWWLDLEVAGMPSTVLWQEGRGFGLFTGKDDGALGDRPTEIYREARDASRRLLQLSAAWKAAGVQPSLALRDVRHLVGETQVEIARALGLDQAGVSRLEARHDWKLSTLRDYISAMGGVLEVRVRFPSFEAPIASDLLAPQGKARDAA